MSDELEDEDKLKLYWEHFFRAETGTYEKSTWLDLFLAEFLIRLNEGADPKELITFCPVSGVVSLVGCELLCGVHRVTSALHAGATMASPGGVVTSPGAVVTSPGAVLASPGVVVAPPNAEVTPSAETVVPSGDTVSPPGETMASFGAAAASPSGAFSRLVVAPGEVLRRYLLAGPAWKCLVLLQALGVEGLSCCRQLSAVLQWACGELDLEGAPPPAPASEPLLPPPAPAPPLHTLLSDRVWSRHARREKREGRGRRLSRGDVDAHSSSSRSSSRSPDRELPALRRLSTATPSRARPARFDDEATPRRRNLMNAELSPAAFLSLATGLLRALCRAESGLVGAEGSQIAVQCVEFALRRLRALAIDERPAATSAARAFTELLLVALDEALARAAPLAPDPLPTLLDLLEVARARAASPPVDINVLRLAFTAGYCIAAVYHRLLVQSRTAERLCEFEERFRLYAERRDGALLGDALELLAASVLGDNEDEALQLTSALGEALGRLVSGAKRASARVEHLSVCARAQHRLCRASGPSAHHAPGARAPCAAGLAARALGLGLASCAHAAPARPLLRVLLRCGTCCCAGATSVLEGAVRLAAAGRAPPELCLRLVERTAFGEAGGGGGAGAGGRTRRACAHCSGGGAFVVQYSALLQPDNDMSVLRAAAAHLARVAPRCRPDARQELLLGVLYPAFIVAKHRYAARREDKARFLTGACLEMFASLLDSVPLAELWVARGGLGYALELADQPQFAERCCAVLEVAVAAELARAPATPEPGAAARALLQALARAGEGARALYCARLPDDEARALSDVNAARAALGLPPEPGDESPPLTPPEEGGWSAHALEATTTRHFSDAEGATRRACAAWRAGAALASCSPAWRRLLARAPLLPRAHALLRLALRAAREEAGAGYALELAESLLMVHVALGDATDGLSLRAGCAAAREAAAAGGAGLRALLEALLRVSTLHVAHTERMPPRHLGSSLPRRASSDGEPEPTPDGYEADVETREAERGAGAGAACAGAGQLAHPDLCLVVLEAAAQLSNKAAEGSPESLSAARGVLSRLAAVVSRHAPAPHAPRLLHALLHAAAPLLTTADTQLHELQRGVLELAETLGSTSGVEPRELACLLRVLRAPTPPLRAVLRVLTRLAARAVADPLTPRHFLPFPALSEVSGAALRVELPAWAPWLQGFALVMWLRAEPPSDISDTDSEGSNSGSSEGTSWHVCSVGGAALQLQTWLESGGALTLRLARGAAELAAARVARALSNARWHCLALQVREAVRRRRIHVQVTVYVDGCECDTVSLPLQGVLVRRAPDASLLAGHAGPGGESAYSLAGLSLYRGAVLDAPGALRRAALGPHAPPARHCLVDRLPPNYAALITPDLLERNLDWDRVYEASSAKADELDDALLLTYSAQTPDVASVFEEAASPAGWDAGGRVVPVTWLVVAPKVVPTRALAHSVAALGGVDALLFLHARVAELRADAEEQAMALTVALQLARAEPALHAAMYCDEALDMIQAVVGGECGEPSAHTVAALLHAACGSVCPLSLAGGRAVLRARSSALVLEPRALLALAAAWRELGAQAQWLVAGAGGGTRAARGSLWALALSAIRALLHSTHPQRAFNLQQLSRAGLLSALLTACRERALGAEGTRAAPDAEASGALVALCRALLHDPPHAAALAHLSDFLVLMHQASDTFVTHSRANFYFLVCAEQHEDERALLPFLRRRSEPAAALAFATEPEPAPADVKELKGFINMQIKEGRMESVSSTTSGISENSETGRIAETPKVDADITEHEVPEKDVTEKKVKETEFSEKSMPETEHEEPFVVVTKTPSTLTEQLSSLESSTSDIGNSENESTDTEDSQDLEKSALEREKVASVLEEGGVIGATKDDVQDDEEGAELQLRIGLLCALRVATRALEGGALSLALPLPALVVLANARAPALRAAAVRLVHALHARQPAPPLTLAHLAHQVSLYPASRELAQACAALLTKCDVPLEDQLNEDIWADAGVDACSRAAPLLALLSACTHECALARDVARVLGRLAEHAPARALHDVHAPEAVMRALRPAALSQPSLLPDLQHLLVQMTLRALELQHGMQRVSDIGALLRHEELSGGAAGAAAREAHCALLLQLMSASATAAAPVSQRYFTVLPSVSGEAAASRRAGLLRAHALLLTHTPLHAPRPPAESALFDACFRALLAEVCSTSGGWTRWRGAGGAGAAALLQELVWQALCGCERAAADALRLLYHAGEPAQRALTPADPSDQRKLAVYLLSALQRVHLWSCGRAAGLELAITDWARAWAQRARPAPGAALHEAARLLRNDALRWARAAIPSQGHRQKALHRLEALAERVTESAMQLTRQVVEQQNTERKRFMEHLRRAQVRASAAAARWARVVDALTHERALWHFPEAWPASWALDDAEGAGRVRVRLRRAQLSVPARLLQEGHKHKAVARAPPLQRVLARARRGLAARLRAHEAVAYTARVLYVSVAREIPGELLLSERAVHFVPEAEDGEGEGARSWALERVSEAASRRWCLQERAVELFLSTGHAHLLAFPDASERDAFLKALHKLRSLPGGSESERLAEAMSAWRCGQLSNWEYLMRLNGLAGRSYNDLMQYPVLPFVLADYGARLLELHDPAAFRDLSRPVAVQQPEREKHYIATYNDLLSAGRGTSVGPARTPHHYASLYSNSGAVLHYLVRVSPFTELFLNYQDNNFDMPDRTFHSLATTWRLITRDSPTDVKELIPEMFYLPELFSNREGLALGVRQCGAAVDTVELPPWAMGDARLFTLVHRQALEAPAVSEGLPAWIDLIFGYKQTGQAAIDALNVFPACTYYGFDPTSIPDELERTAAEAMVRTYGQAPRQLLRTPHPRRTIDPLAPPAQAAPPVWGGVRDARWGDYCGSPALPPPRMTLRRQASGPVAARVQCLPRGRSAALLGSGAVLVRLQSDAAPALLTWGHADHALRLRRRRDAPPDRVLHVPPDDRVVTVATCLSGEWPVFVGLSSGCILVVRGGGGLGAHGLRARTLRLHAHAHGLVELVACARAGLLASAGADGRVVLWDLHRLQYLRSLPHEAGARVRRLAVSPTLADVCAAHAHAAGALLRVHTCNGVLVGTATVPENVTSLCYSTAPEGVSVNCIAAGLSSGGVRLYSSWDLQPRARIPSAAGSMPLVSVCYSRDADVLFGCYADGSAAAWESEPARSQPRLLPAHALL